MAITPVPTNDELARLSEEKYAAVRDQFLVEVEAEYSGALQPAQMDAMISTLMEHPGLLASDEVLESFRFATRPKMEEAVKNLVQDIKTDADLQDKFVKGLNFIPEEDRRKLVSGTLAPDADKITSALVEAAESTEAGYAAGLLNDKKYDEFKKYIVNKPYLLGWEVQDRKGKDICLDALYLKETHDVDFLKGLQTQDLKTLSDYEGPITDTRETQLKASIKDAVQDFEDKTAHKAESKRKWGKGLKWTGIIGVVGTAAAFATIWLSGFGKNDKSMLNMDTGSTGPAISRNTTPPAQPDVDIKITKENSDVDGSNSEPATKDSSQKSDVSADNQATNDTNAAATTDNQGTETDKKSDADSSKPEADTTATAPAPEAKTDADKETTTTTSDADDNAAKAQADKTSPDNGNVDTTKATGDASKEITIPDLNGKKVIIRFGAGPSFANTDEYMTNWALGQAADYWATTDKDAQANHTWKKIQEANPEFATAAKRWAQYVQDSGLKKTSDAENVYNPASHDKSVAEFAKILQEEHVMGDNVVQTINDKELDSSIHERGAHLVNTPQDTDHTDVSTDKNDKADKNTKDKGESPASDSADHSAAAMAGHYLQTYHADLFDQLGVDSWKISNSHVAPDGLIVELANGETITFGNGYVEVDHGDRDTIHPETLDILVKVMKAKDGATVEGFCAKQVNDAVAAAGKSPAANTNRTPPKPGAAAGSGALQPGLY